MTSESETPGAAGTATEGETLSEEVPPIRLDWSVTKPTDPVHLQWAEAACLALAECRKQDRAAICAAVLDTMQTAGPRHDAFGLLYEDARWWADMAPPHELVAYGTAALDRLRGLALGKDDPAAFRWQVSAVYNAVAALLAGLDEHDDL